MSKKIKFIKHPGYVHPVGNDVWVDSMNKYYLYPIDNSPILQRLFDSSIGYVISKQQFVKLKELTSGIIFTYWGEIPSSMWQSNWEGSSCFIYGVYFDTRFLMFNANYKGSFRYKSDKSAETLKFGDKLIFTETSEDNTNTNLKKKEVMIEYPCWFSKTFLGVYQPFGNASGTITVGTPVVKDDVKTYETGNKWNLIYAGSLPVWH